MRPSERLIIVCLAAGLITYGCTNKTPKPGSGPAEPPPVAGKPGGPVMVGKRNLAFDPPAVTELTVAPVAGKAALTEANAQARLTVRFAPNENLPAVLPLDLEGGIVELRDDGQGADEKKGDGLFSAIVSESFMQMTKGLDTLSKRAGPAEEVQFVDRKLVRRRTMDRDKIRRLRDLLDQGLPVPPVPTLLAADVSIEQSLMITDLSVVNDPARTFNPCVPGSGTPMGKWTFGYLMTQMCNQPQTGIDPSDFARRWLRRWEVTQTVNDLSVPARLGIQMKIITHWEQLSGVQPGGKLDLAKAPFRLLAIVNRVDLRKNAVYGGDGGEARFVFGALGPDCNPLPFSVIFEYGVPKTGCAVRAWGQQWVDLTANPVGSPPYNVALELITEQFAAANAAPAKPNGSALNQLRTNEIALTAPWELREFKLFDTDSDAHHLRLVTVKQTPDLLTINNTPRIASYVNANEASIIAQLHDVPIEFPPGQPFLGGSAITNPGMFWNDVPPGPPTSAITNPKGRHMFSLQTCNGCHAGETNTPFVHVDPSSSPGQPARLSGFLTGKNFNGQPPFIVPDPAHPNDATLANEFNDLLRRQDDLASLVSLPCFAQLMHKPLRMTH